ncbi:hypothetical protein ACLOJK_024432 [Asimina triloba]
METRSQPMFEDLSGSHLDAQSPCPAEIPEDISSTGEDTCTEDAVAASERTCLSNQKLGIIGNYEAVLDGCGGSSSKTQNLSSVKTSEATSDEDDDLGSYNLKETASTLDDFKTQNLILADINEKISTEPSSAIPMEFGNISTEINNVKNKNSHLMKTMEDLSIETETLRTQNLLLLKSHEAISTQLKYLETQNLDLANSLKQIQVDRDAFQAQIFIISASLRCACSERDDLQSKLHMIEEEIRLLLEERNERIQVFLEEADTLASVKECLKRIGHQINNRKLDQPAEEEEQVLLSADKEPTQLSLEAADVYMLATALESMIKEQDEELKLRMQVLSESSDSFQAAKECLVRIAGVGHEDKTANSVIGNEQVQDEMDVGEDSRKVPIDIEEIYKLAVAAESRIVERDEIRRREIEELQEETRNRVQVFSDNYSSLQTVKDCLTRIIERVRDEMNNLCKEDERTLPGQLNLDEDSKSASMEITDIHKLATLVEAQILEHEESRQKEMRYLEERSRRIGVLFDSFDSLQSIKECLTRIMQRFGVNVEHTIGEDGQVPKELDLDKESERVFFEIGGICKLAMAAEAQIVEHDDMRKKEIRELENSVVSLTEENRDINSLLKIALAEKEAVEKSLSRLKGSGEHRRLPILQIVQRVGLTFMMGSSSSTSTADQSESSSNNNGTRSDGSECEEEVISLASTVEKIMKNLRLEISRLRRSLDESSISSVEVNIVEFKLRSFVGTPNSIRKTSSKVDLKLANLQQILCIDITGPTKKSDCERLHSLTEKQAQKIEESTLYIKDLEERETMLTQNVEDLMTELAQAEEEIVRWREACELEVEAAKAAVEERDKQAAILKEELEKTKGSLEETKGKLKLKEEVAAAAMGAQAAAEKSLQLADSRTAAFRERIEELSRELEEAESRRERANRRKARHVCWPWPSLRISPAAARLRQQNLSRRMPPEMEALLHPHTN